MSMSRYNPAYILSMYLPQFVVIVNNIRGTDVWVIWYNMLKRVTVFIFLLFLRNHRNVDIQ